MHSPEGFGYKATLFFGSEEQPVDVAFSTVAPLSVINAAEHCESCSGTGFDFLSSSSIRRLVESKQSYDIEGYRAEGVIVEDNMKLRYRAE